LQFKFLISKRKCEQFGVFGVDTEEMSGCGI